MTLTRGLRKLATLAFGLSARSLLLGVGQTKLAKSLA